MTEYNIKENETKDLLSLYNTIDWIDFGLVIAIIAYFTSGSYANSPLIGLALTLVSLGVSLSAIVVSNALRKRMAISSLRLIIRYIVWGIWIPIDLALIVYYFLQVIRAA